MTENTTKPTPGPWTECTCPSGQSGHPHASWCAKEARHASADAVLIGELLDALVSINNCIAYSDGYGEWYLVGKFRTMPALTKVRAAIAKATGAEETPVSDMETFVSDEELP